MVDGIVLLVDASRGPAAADPVRAAQGAERRHAGRARGQQGRPRRRPDRRGRRRDLRAVPRPARRAPQPGRPRLPGRLRLGQGRPRLASSVPDDGGMPDSPDLEPLFRTILETDPGADVRRGRAAAGPRHQPRRLAVPRPAGAAARPPGRAPQGPDRSPGCKRDGTVKNVKVTELLVTEGLERKPGESAGPGDIVAVAGIPEITIGETLADPENPVAAAADPRRRAGDLDDDRHQHLAAGRPGQGRQGHRPPGQGPPRRRAGRQRVAAGAARPSAPTPGRSRAAASWRWRSWSSRCAARASS